jgi:hypothetical protein
MDLLRVRIDGCTFTTAPKKGFKSYYAAFTCGTKPRHGPQRPCRGKMCGGMLGAMARCNGAYCPSAARQAALNGHIAAARELSAIF